MELIGIAILFLFLIKIINKFPSRPIDNKPQKHKPDYKDSEVKVYQATDTTLSQVMAQGKKYVIRTYNSGYQCIHWL